MKKKSLLIFVIYLFTASCFAQPFQVGHRQQSFTDASRANRNITTEIYYPAITGGNNAAIASGQFPVLVFGHGFVMTWSAYDVLWNAIVPSGYIMVFATTETSFSPSHAEFGKDIAFLVGALKNEATIPASAFYNSVAATSAVMGHSMGGGSSFLAVQYDFSITAIATLAPAVTNPSSVSAARNITIPSIVFSGANDCVTPPAQHQIPMYDSLMSACKTFVGITGASHCRFANYNINCYAGEGTCFPQATISATAQHTTTFNLLLPWLNFYLKNDCAAATQFQSLISGGSGITSMQNCLLTCSTVGEDEILRSNITIFPNPANADITFKSTTDLKQATVTIYSIDGEKVKTVVNVSGKDFTLSRENIRAGLYFICFSKDNIILATEKLVIAD